MKVIVGAVLSLLALNTNAVVVKTLNGTTYEWLELAETRAMHRVQVKSMLNDTSSQLYGYEYASRALVQELFLSYSSWDGLDGYHGAPEAIQGSYEFLTEFGVLWKEVPDGNASITTTVDGYTIEVDGRIESIALYGADDECIDEWIACQAAISVQFDTNNNLVSALQRSDLGWDATTPNPSMVGFSWSSWYAGSFLVKERASVVPIPSAVWLFGSGLIGLIGFARRKA